MILQNISFYGNFSKLLRMLLMDILIYKQKHFIIGIFKKVI
jgi:hypothetical protein